MPEPLPAAEPALDPEAPQVRARRILVIDDDPQICHAVRRALGPLATEVDAAGSGEEGLAMAAAGQPELVVLDLGLPDRPGLEICRELRRWTKVPILVLSARHSEQEKVSLLDAGADDYLTKPFGTRELIARVRAQLRRAALGGPGASPVIRTHGLTVDLAQRRVSRGGAAIHLTPIEWELLRTLVGQAGRTLTHRQIFDAVWGQKFGNPQQYLRVHVTNLRRKVEQDPARPRLIVTEPGVGYRAELGD
jgi:two-component system KDP operon response regulator KdpE